MSKKDYNNGAKMGLKLAENIVKRDTEAIEYLSKQVEKLPGVLQDIKEVINQISSDVEYIQIEKIFGTVKTFNEEDLEYEEKIILMRIIRKIALRYSASEKQKQFSRRLGQYLKVNVNDVIQGAEYEGKLSEIIDSINVHRIMYQIVKEYLYLENNTNDYGNKYDEILYIFSNDVDKNVTERLINIKVCLFGIEGLYEQFGEEIDEKKDFSFLNIQQRPFVEISKECAKVYFDNAAKRKINRYCESANYVVFVENNNIVYVNKTDAIKKILMRDIEDIEVIFEDKRITAYQDMIFIVIDNEVYYFDLEQDKSGKVMKLKERYKENGELVSVKNICLSNKKFIYGSDKLYVYDLEKGESVIALDETGASMRANTDYILIGDYIYYISDYDKFDKEIFSGKRICKYGLNNGVSSVVSKPFGVRKMMKYSTNVFHFCSYNNYLAIVMEYSSLDVLTSDDRDGFECVYVDITQEEAEAKLFFIWSNYVYQMSSYQNYLVYVNASKNYGIQLHNYLTDKKKTLVKKYGSNEKVSLSEKIFMGKQYYQHPKEYMIMGKWLWYKEDSWNERISSVC